MSKRRLLIVLTLGGAALALLVGFQAAGAEQKPSPESIARGYLTERSAIAGADSTELDLLEVRESPGAFHARFQQTIDGIPLFGGHASVSISKANDGVTYALDRRKAAVAAGAAGTSITVEQAIERARSAVGVELPRDDASASRVYVAIDGSALLAWDVTLPALRPLGDWRVLVLAGSGAVLQKSNLLRYETGQVFDPNPVVSSGGTIPPPLDCETAPNQTLLAPQYRTRTISGIATGQHQLKGQYVDLSAPGILGSVLPAGLANEISGVYSYPCNDPRFEETMVYYHVDTTQRKIQSLGFTGKSSILARPISAHAHWDDGFGSLTCNGFYSPIDQGIHFGESDGMLACPDVGEDADFIIHEYGHAVQDDQVSSLGVGSLIEVEHSYSMGEGFGDFLAAAITGDPCWVEWSRPSFYTECSGPGLRSLQNSRNFPAGFEACEDLEGGIEEPHCGGEVWSGALWDLVEALGNDQAARDLVLQLVLASHFYLDPMASFFEGAAAIRQADIDMHGGMHVSAIDAAFAARGISGGAVSDFPYAHLLIRHTFRGDLAINIIVGDPNSPDCQMEILPPDPNDFVPDVFGYEDLAGSLCEQFLPPTTERPWSLGVQDTFENDVGFIIDFDIALSGTKRCFATDVPVFIPDDTDPVYATVDCTVTSDLPGSAPPPTSTPIATQTAVEATATHTPTGVAPTDTPVVTGVQTHTPTNTPVPPTNTPTRTRTPTPEPQDAGDADCNGTVNSIDATLILQVSAGLLNALACGDAADINGDGRIDSLDAALVLQFVAGFVNRL